MRSRRDATGTAASLADGLSKKVEENADAPLASRTVPAPPPSEATAPPEKPRREPPPALFATAHGPVPGVTPDFQRVVETIYAADAMADYDDLEKNLVVGEERGDLRSLQAHLDRGEDRARRAHRLYLGAKLELERWDADQKVVWSKMREKCRDQLEQEKRDGERKKVIANADIDERIADQFPDEWRHYAVNKAKMKGTVEHLERLADLWKQRCHSLGTLLTTLRK
jgi:hypothetical protein